MSTRPTRRRIVTQSLLGGAALSAQTTSSQTPPPAPADPRQRLQSMIAGFQVAQMIHVAAKLRLADHLKDGPQSVGQLAAATGSHEDTLYRLLRTLASMGIFTEEDGMSFRLNAAASYLQSGVPGSLRVAAEVAGEDWMWRPWGDLLHSVKTGQTAFDHLYGKGTFDWFPEHPDAARLFDEFQAETTGGSIKAILGAYDFSTTRKLVDVGGGNGTLLSAILQANPSTAGVLFDLDNVVASARSKLDKAVMNRVEFEGGDFFKAVPQGGDVYLLKYILHDWNDESCQNILKNTSKAMSGKGRLLVIEDLICGPNQPCLSKNQDVLMLVRTGGRNRTEKEYRELLSRGGFVTTKVFPTAANHSILEALPK
ncbi:MAG: methyltransferase domain-containing protein [Bryobacteraceae bacterium]|nr:methyltransferase domain-containing protein [Bryobacteraceae bacterium]